MRILGIVALGAALGLSLLCNSAAAQQMNPAVAQSRKAYDDCVYDSVIAQLQQMPVGTRRNADVSFLGEQGFLACSTEERVLGVTLTINNVSPQVVGAALLGIRAQIKRTLRQIAADPKKVQQIALSPASFLWSDTILQTRATRPGLFEGFRWGANDGQGD